MTSVPLGSSHQVAVHRHCSSRLIQSIKLILNACSSCLFWIYPNCLCEENDEDSVCDSDSSVESQIEVKMFKDNENNAEKKPELGLKGIMLDTSSSSSMTTVTDDTSASELNIICSISSKGTAINYFIPEKYTRTKVRKFHKPHRKQYTVEASSAINRRKKQFEIDRENLMILRRLKEVKPVVNLPK